MKPDISIVDANLVMEDNFGAAHGCSKRLLLLIDSNDRVAVDSL
jgi:uncharacterized protein (DUF362 family)